jgi:hypothetical protein
VVLAILIYLNAVSTFPLGSREEGEGSMRGGEYERRYSERGEV